jgi:hypothetical protein
LHEENIKVNHIHLQFPSRTKGFRIFYYFKEEGLNIIIDYDSNFDFNFIVIKNYYYFVIIKIKLGHGNLNYYFRAVYIICF